MWTQSLQHNTKNLGLCQFGVISDTIVDSFKRHEQQEISELA